MNAASTPYDLVRTGLEWPEFVFVSARRVERTVGQLPEAATRKIQENVRFKGSRRTCDSRDPEAGAAQGIQK